MCNVIKALLQPLCKNNWNMKVHFPFIGKDTTCNGQTYSKYGNECFEIEYNKDVNKDVILT